MSAGLPPAGDRGVTRVSGRAHERIAAAAAAEALEAASAGRRAGLPRASVRIRRGGSRIKIGVVLPYPSDLGASCARLRDAVAERSALLTGTPVRRVGVTVDGLTTAEEPPADGGVRAARDRGEPAGSDRGVRTGTGREEPAASAGPERSAEPVDGAERV